MIGIVDYGAGNLGSVENALIRLKIPASFIRGPEELGKNSPYEKIIFPGDGHFATAMDSLEKSGLSQALKEWILADRPFLGICIGLQLLFENSEEAEDKELSGLSVIKGRVRKFPGRKLPQIGWNSTLARPSSRLFKGIPENTFFYYIHSYYVLPREERVIAAEAEYYLKYCSAVEQGALAAIQFHPEKSGPWGLKLLSNWAGME